MNEPLRPIGIARSSPLGAAALSERRFRTLFDRAAVGMCFVALDGRFLEANARLSEIVGLSSEELSRTTCVALTHPDDRSYEDEMTSRMMAGEFANATWEKRYVGPDGRAVWCNLTLTLLADEAGDPQQFVGVIEDITARRHAEAELAQSQSLVRIAGETARLGGWALDCTDASGFADARLSWSSEVCAIHDVASNAIGNVREALSYCLAPSRDRMTAAIDACLRAGTPYDLEIEIVTALGRNRWVRSIGRLEAQSRRLVGAYQDITERKSAELEMVRMNRALTMLKGCTEVLVRATDEAQLLHDICALVVESGGYGMAWVGYALDDAHGSVEPVASAGTGEAYLAHAALSWRDDLPEGRGVCGETIRGGRPSVVANVATDERFAPWRERALAAGFRSVIGLPLRHGAVTFGILALYGAEFSSPPQGELELLGELADDLAFGIQHLRSQVEQRRVHDAVVKISAARLDPLEQRLLRTPRRKPDGCARRGRCRDRALRSGPPESAAKHRGDRGRRRPRCDGYRARSDALRRRHRRSHVRRCGSRRGAVSRLRARANDAGSSLRGQTARRFVG